MRKFWYLSIAATLHLLVQSQLALSDEKGPCSEDATKLCKDIKFGTGSVYNCLLEKKKVASSGCSQHISRLEQYKIDCSVEINKLCKDKPFYCLLYPSGIENTDNKISNLCLVSIFGKMDFFSDCRSDLNTSCSATPSTSQELLTCLRESKTLKPQCKSFLEK